jgi:nucleoside-diphosphate-sugar epimerase
MQPKPISPLGEMALEIENKLRMLNRLSKVPFVILRAFPIYGPYEESIGPEATLTGIFKKNYDLNTPITIFGDGSNRLDFIHVDDVVSGIILAAQTSKSDNQLINLGSGDSISIKEVADMTSLPSKYMAPIKHNVKILLADTYRMKSILGLKLNHTFSASYPKILRNQSYSLKIDDAYKWVSDVDIELAPWILNSGYTFIRLILETSLYLIILLQIVFHKP